jgi:predicted metal-dependent HD superfamily phosphohydrolase
MNWSGKHRWLRLWRTVGASGDAAPWYDRLTRAYGEPHRHYHNLQHIAECLAEFDAARSVMHPSAAVELALWFHDAVYDPRAEDNEEQSAAMARHCLGAAGVSRLAAPVSDLVMATKAHRGEAGPDSALVVDIDLSILGQGEHRFSEYEAQIRAEYGWVPQAIFNSKRAQILERFLARRHIYTTHVFAAKYEEQARRNLENSILKLKDVPG